MAFAVGLKDGTTQKEKKELRTFNRMAKPFTTGAPGAPLGVPLALPGVPLAFPGGPLATSRGTEACASPRNLPVGSTFYRYCPLVGQKDPQKYPEKGNFAKIVKYDSTLLLDMVNGVNCEYDESEYACSCTQLLNQLLKNDQLKNAEQIELTFAASSKHVEHACKCYLKAATLNGYKYVQLPHARCKYTKPHAITSTNFRKTCANILSDELDCDYEEEWIITK